ncbi:MAG: amidohydrolase family protein [Candidatus Aminicenantes bacterium]
MKSCPASLVGLSLCVVLIFSSLSCENTPPVYNQLLDVIERTPFIDVHAHPVLGHRPYSDRDPYPTLEPLIGRSYWPIPERRIAVFDTFQPAALREIYGYEKNDVGDADIPHLERLSKEMWEQGKKETFNRILDLSGIERVLANTGRPLEAADEKRVLWVPFVDGLFYPLDPSEMRSIDPGLKRALKAYSAENAELAREYGIRIKDLASHLGLIGCVLADYKKEKAVALKVASAYIRTLWFDPVEKAEAAALFAEGIDRKLRSWTDYKKVQDYLARWIFLKAAELDLPVHFHTGFGATATLRNQDSNPLNLESVFSDMRFKDTRFVMLHTGYPFGDKIKPMLEKRNVFVEFSAANWMVFDDELADILFDWLSYPGAAEKIMFGSDAGAPVFFWIAAKNSRQALYKALSRLIERKRIDEDKAVLIAKLIIRDNALRIHDLEEASPTPR